jgi:FtsZ-binding cell division protein ZapB
MKSTVLLFYVFLVFAATIIYLYMNMSELKETNDTLMQKNDSLVSVKNRIETELKEKKPPKKEFRYFR